MAKPATMAGYDSAYTKQCERMLVTLLRGLGPWKKSVFLIGGLTPRYLVPDRPPNVPPHAGTGDVDIVIDLTMLADTEAYRTLEENLNKMGFERAENANGKKVSWRWKIKAEDGAVLVLEFLADDPALRGGKVQELPTKGNISALNIPYASMVTRLHEIVELEVDLLGNNGIVKEEVRYADIVSFTCLKAFAFDDRAERKDAHDLCYCIEHAPGGVEAMAARFKGSLSGEDGAAIAKALAILSNRFVTSGETAGYQKDGPVAVARFEKGDEEGVAMREARILRQREVSALIEELLKRL